MKAKKKRRSNRVASDDLLGVLETASRDLLAWDEKYPKGTVYNDGQHKACENELTALIERFRVLLTPNATLTGERRRKNEHR